MQRIYRSQKESVMIFSVIGIYNHLLFLYKNVEKCGKNKI